MCLSLQKKNGCPCFREGVGAGDGVAALGAGAGLSCSRALGRCRKLAVQAACTWHILVPRIRGFCLAMWVYAGAILYA